MEKQILSVVITTRNEEANIAACISPFFQRIRDGACELLVVDNGSTDDTVRLAEKLGVRVIRQGPERSAQRNRGFREARGEFVLYLDADMIMPEETIAEIIARVASPDAPDAMYIREVRTGKGLWTKARNFERGFYDATCIDAVRVVRKSLMEKIGGFDEELCGPEDWDLDRRIIATGAKMALTDGHLLHNEKKLTFKKMLRKKAYYSQSFDRYKAKWGNDEIIRKQFGLEYRFFTVFLENGKWKRVLRHPLLFCLVMLDRLAVGLVYLLHR